MLGYYKIDENELAKLNLQYKNIEDNIYDLCCPLVIGKPLPPDLKCLYETLEIPIISYKQINDFDFQKYEHLTKYLDYFSEYLKLNIPIELLEEKSLGHLLRVGRYAKELAEKISLDKKEVKDIYIAALFHDVGKYLIPSQIVGKEGKLTDREFELMKKHSEYASRILKNFFSDNILTMIREHHERCNKNGYPDHIVPSLGAKIIGIADSYDAMISNRVYHQKKTKDEALAELLRCSMSDYNGGKGILYDKYLVEKFIELQNKQLADSIK